MAIKARWTKDGKIYLFLGVGYGQYKALAAGNFMQSLAPSEDSGETGMVAMCDKNGKIGWVDHSEVEIVEIDGEPPGQLLQRF